MSKYHVTVEGKYDEETKRYEELTYEVEANNFYVSKYGGLVLHRKDAEGLSVATAAFNDWRRVAEVKD